MKIIISNAKNQPIYEQIYEQIKNLIITEELEAGQMLPSIRGLAKDLRISVITTKRAYDELEKDGFINSVAGKGCFVAEKNLEIIKEENLKKVEQYLEKAVKLSRTCGLTKDDLIDQASLYLRIYALCMPAMGIYNFGNGVLSARGETKRPLYYLAIAGVLNVLLNLFFVIVFHMAAAGVATATAIAQYVSAALIMIHLVRRKDECHVSLKNIRFHRDAGVQVLMIGIPAGIQSAVFAIANLFVQAGVNSFNTITVSGNAAATNADSLIFNVLYAFYTGCSSFMSQNYGARNKKRVLKSYFVCLFYSFSASVLLGVLLFVFGHQFLSLFATDAAVIDAGMQRIRIMAFSYAVSVFMDCTTAASRGIGKTIVPTIIILLGSCAFRIIWIYTIFAWIHTIPSLYLLYVFSWLITSAAEIIYFIISYRKLKC